MPDLRIPRFESHIRPMIRWVDRHRMLQLPSSIRIDLWDYHQVVAKADRIKDRLRRGMPPASHGGPWPEEWIALFERWVDAGCPRQEAATAATLAALRVAIGFVTLRVTGEVPEFGYEVWLDAISGGDPPSEFALYQEGPPPTGAPAEPYTVEENILDPWPTVQAFRVHDANGVHEVPVPPPVAPPIA